MEPTQKLDEDEEPHIREKVKAEEIGILGICGKTYPITMGPNNIGRDASQVDICLNVQSISKLHAVINILSKREFMLMDFNSVNKTKVGTKVLQPYIQYPIHNGDIIHFGKVFGIFRIHEDNSSLPCTQAEPPVPETPVKPSIHSIHSIATQIIPESPEVSEDESFFSISRNRDSEQKPDSIDNVEKVSNIHEMATQLPYAIDRNDNAVHTDETLADSRRKGIVDISNRLNRNQTVVMACDNTVKDSTQLFDNDQVDLTKCQGEGVVTETAELADLKPDDVFDQEIESKIIDHITIEPTQISRIAEPAPNIDVQKISSQIVQIKDEKSAELKKVTTQVGNSVEKVDSPFKVPLSPVKAKKRDKSAMSPAILNSSVSEDIEEENYYCLTQEIFDDLNDQQISKASEVDELQNDSEIHGNISNYLNIFSPDIVPDPNTPVKCHSKSFIDAELPSSQEIKSSVRSLFKEVVPAAVSSDSDSDTPHSEENTPVLFRKKIRSKGNSKTNNANQVLPPRRIRKPNKKYVDSKSVPDINEDDVVDRDIVLENMKRLKSNSKASSSSKEKERKPQCSKDKESEGSNTKNNDNKVKDTDQEKKDREKKNEQKKRDDEKKKEQKKRDDERMKEQKRKDDEKIKEQKRKEDERKKEQKRKEADKKKEQKKKDDEKKVKSNKDKNKSKDDSSKSGVEDLRRSDRLKNDRRTNGSSRSLASTSGEHSRKRTSDDNIERSNSKRRKAGSDRTDNESSSSKSVRTIKQKHSILFASYPDDVVINKVFKDLGCDIVSDVFECTIVVCLFLKSTKKLLCAVGMGKPIVGPDWIQACVNANMVVDPWKYIIRDEIKEKRLNFNLKKTLLGKRNFLKGYSVSCTPHVDLPSADLKLIIECSGGVWKEGGPKWLCISTAEERESWSRYRKMGATIVSPEVIFNGVMCQTLNLPNNIIHALPTLRLHCI